MIRHLIAETMPRLWLIRGGVDGEDEAYNFREGVTSIHWNDVLDPRTHSQKELEAYIAVDPTKRGGPHAAGQIYRFCHAITGGDYIVTPLWNRGRQYQRVAVGRVVGAYDCLDYEPTVGPRQTRPVKWVVEDLDRESLGSVTQERLLQRHTVQRILDNRIVRDILSHAGVVATNMSTRTPA